MKLPRYELIAEKSMMVFEFTSEGQNGHIPKLIKFSPTSIEEVYNLAFGDKDLDTGDIDDQSVSNNGDSEQVLATVVSAVLPFWTVIQEIGFMQPEVRKPEIGFTGWVLRNI
jgi:hypothetical protein